ncbi:MAG: lytic transglycosylase domain-containing protein [Longimicrobiales bacterium]
MEEQLEAPENTGPWRGYVSPPSRIVSGPDLPGYLLWQWEREKHSPWRFRIATTWRKHHKHVQIVAIVVCAFLLGAILTGSPATEVRNLALREEVRRANNEVIARQGELELARIDLSRASTILEYSGRHRIPGDLAVSIYDIAVAEGIDPKVAFALVGVESDFTQRAVSPVGAIGLAQLMPETASWLQPGIRGEALFDRETNLRLGFRYLRMLVTQYKGDLNMALLAYNRGPARVDEILHAGGNPSNGYTQLIKNRGATQQP